MKIIIGGVIVFAVLAMRVTRNLGLEKWHTSLGLVAIGVAMYVINFILIQYFIKRHMPDFLSKEEVSPDVQKWELTAGLGIVPKWVSVIGLLGISAVITALLPWVVAFFK